MKAAKSKEQLQGEIRKLQLELNKILNAETEAKSLVYLGQCFKTTNNYSLPKKPSDYWFRYVKVIDVKGGAIKALMFETDRDGRIQIEPTHYVMLQTLDGYTLISEKEWQKAWSKCLGKARALGVQK